MDVKIRPFTKADHPHLWAILKPIFRAGETYAINPLVSKRQAVKYWTKGTHTAFVAHIGNDILGTYYICPNQGGNGAHICNCGYATHTDAQGKGIARVMLEHSFSTARDMGFHAMQFNFVLRSNNRAIAIWEKNGFDVIGRIPKAFNHPSDGYVDALIMHKIL